MAQRQIKHPGSQRPSIGHCNTSRRMNTQAEIHSRCQINVKEKDANPEATGGLFPVWTLVLQRPYAVEASSGGTLKKSRERRTATLHVYSVCVIPSHSAIPVSHDCLRAPLVGVATNRGMTIPVLTIHSIQSYSIHSIQSYSDRHG